MGMSQTGIQGQKFGPGLTKSVEFLGSAAKRPNKPAPEIGEPGPVLLVGAPGVGKGTQAGTLAKLWGVPKISTGDILRANVANGTALGVQADRIMKLGGLVPDQIMTEMVADRLDLSDTATGFILDGFPRTVRQAQWLDGYLSVQRGGAHLGVISMCMDLKQIVERVIYRRVCPLCKTVYNAQYMPPKQVGRCDKDGSELEKRSDDSLEVFQTRLDVFKRETEPLIQYYRHRSLFIEVDADKPPTLVTRDIVSGLMGLRTQLSR